MITMNFNYTYSKIFLLTSIFLSGFSAVGTKAVAEVSNRSVAGEPVLLAPHSLIIAQNETLPVANLETEIIDQINRARLNPNDYADWLEEQKQYYDGIMLKLPGEKPVRTNRGLRALTEAIDFVRQQSPLTPLTYSEAMTIAAQEQLTPITENQRDRRSRNLSYGKVTAEGIVFQLIVDDSFRDRRHRLAIFSPSIQEAGVFCQADRIYEQICAISYQENPETTVLQEGEPSNLVTEAPEEIASESDNAPRFADLGEIAPETTETTSSRKPEDLVFNEDNPSNLRTEAPEEIAPESENAPRFADLGEIAPETTETTSSRKPEDLVFNEDNPSNLGTEAPEEITSEPENAIAAETTKTALPETIDSSQTPSVEENTVEPEIEEENTTPSALNIPSQTSFATNKVERGFLEEGDKVIPNDGSFYDSYPLVVEAGESFVISLESTDFDTFLAIMDAEGNIIEQNDDISENDSNSQLQVTIPRGGTYSLIVNAYDREGKGAYILTISR